MFGKHLSKILVRSFAAIVVTVQVLSGLVINHDVNADIELNDFIRRLYQVTLDREAEFDGLNYWSTELYNKRMTASSCAHGFFFSDEYLNKNKSDEDFVQDIYEVFMGREPDQAGHDYWVSQLASISREDVFAGFANSDEFYEVCEEYFIIPGFYSPAFSTEQLDRVNCFVDRFYWQCFSRSGDREGQSFWVQGLLSGQIDGVTCAASFIMCEEFDSLEYDNYGFVNAMYRLFMDRYPDDEGMAYWIGQLEAGNSRQFVFANFANSAEFEGVCNFYGISRGYFEWEETANPPVPPYEDDMTRALGALNCVSDVGYDKTNNLYMFKVEQPVDWSNPNGEKFKQSVAIDLVGMNKNTVFSVNGYELEIYEEELSKQYNCNTVYVEYRFFSESVPESFPNNPAPYWKYLTMENAAKDFHHIIDLLKTVFNGKWIFTGGSKGGETTNYQSMMFPNDADAFVAYVAPLFSSAAQKGFGKYLYEEIGDERFGKEKAAELRALVLDYQIALLEARPQIQPFVVDDNEEYRRPGYPVLSPDKEYDSFVFDQACMFWQYGPFDEEVEYMQGIVDKYRNGDDTYIQDLMEDYEPVWIYLDEYRRGKDLYSPYDYENFCINCAKESGAFAEDYSYLRKALKERGSTAYVAMTEADEAKGWLWTFIATDVYKTLKFDTTYYPSMIEWSHNTKSTVIELYGSSDIYTYFRFPDVDDNPNFHLFIAKDKCHQGDFADSEIWPEVTKILDPILAA